jgi:hypothetical protein
MNWFRSKARSCARLALFALALQMVLSFGHMHPADLGLPPLAEPAGAQAKISLAHAVATPGDQDQQPASDDYCPICASIALSGTWMPALSPALVEPVPISRGWLPQLSRHSLSAQFAASFQARAPPLT